MSKRLVSMLARNQVSESVAMSILLIFRIVDNSSVLLTSDLAFKRTNDGSVLDWLAVDFWFTVLTEMRLLRFRCRGQDGITRGRRVLCEGILVLHSTTLTTFSPFFLLLQTFKDFKKFHTLLGTLHVRAWLKISEHEYFCWWYSGSFGGRLGCGCSHLWCVPSHSFELTVQSQNAGYQRGCWLSQ